MPIGRPSEFTPEMGTKICERLAQGRSVRNICENDDDVPRRSTVYSWLTKFPAFADQYARAREACLELHADDILDIADDGTNDWMAREGEDGAAGYAVNGENIQRSRLRVDARKWLLSKLLPKKYGERLALAGDGESPLVVQVVQYLDKS